MEALLIRKPVDQQRHAGFVHQLHARHVDVPRNRIAEIEREKVQVIVGVQRVAVVFDVAADLQMPAAIEQRPGWRGQAQSAHVEVFHPHTVLREDMLDPRQAAVAIAARAAGLFDITFQQVLGQSVDFQNDDALDFADLRRISGREERCGQKQERDGPHRVIVPPRRRCRRARAAHSSRVSASLVCCMIRETTCAERAGTPVAISSFTARRTSAIFQTTSGCGLDWATVSRNRIWRSARRSRPTAAARLALSCISWWE